MNYSALSSGLMKEVFALKQYKHLDTPYDILAFIALMPVHIFAAMTFVSYHILSFIFNMLSSGVSYLELWMKETKQGVNHATEAVIYFICLPILLFCHFFLSMLAVGFFIIWFELQCSLYISTLGGIRWQPYINRAHFSIGINEYKVTTSDTWGARVAAITFVSFAALIISWFILISDSSANSSESIGWIVSVYLIMAFVAIPVTFRKVRITNANNGNNTLP